MVSKEERIVIDPNYSCFCPGCPGTPFNKLYNPRQRTSQIKGIKVREGERSLYLTGILSEILLREGLMHGDPQLRHFVLLPQTGDVADFDNKGQNYLSPSNNGLGVIDVENAKREGPCSEEVVKEVEFLKEKVLTHFFSEKGEEFYDRGSSLIKSKCEGVTLANTAYKVAYNIMCKNIADFVLKVDMQEMSVHYK